MIRYTNMKYGNILILFMLNSNLKSQKGKNLRFNDHSIQKQEVTQGLNCFFFPRQCDLSRRHGQFDCGLG